MVITSGTLFFFGFFMLHVFSWLFFFVSSMCDNQSFIDVQHYSQVQGRQKAREDVLKLTPVLCRCCLKIWDELLKELSIPDGTRHQEWLDAVLRDMQLSTSCIPSCITCWASQ